MMDFEQTLRSAGGYVGLGMFRDAWNESETHAPTLRAQDAVFELRIAIFKGLEKWESARVLAESLARRSPENHRWWAAMGIRPAA